jgi:protein-disulfide isomerase
MWLSLGFFLVAGLIGPVAAQTPSSSPTASRVALDPAQLAPRKEGDDMVMGLATAPVTIIEYASLTCPHCAAFATAALPDIKTQYVDKGLVKFVYRDFPLDRMALQASKLARCSGPERYFAFIDVLFRQQATWTRGNDANQIMDNLRRLARLGGMSDTAVDACLRDTAIENAILEQRMKGERDDKVSSTPTIIINGRKYAGDLNFAEIEKTLKPLVGSGS